MAVEDKKISSLTEWVYGSIADTANIVVAHLGGNYKIAMSTIRKYVLGDREIGGTGSSDIVTTGDAQILANKRLDSPSFNDEVQLNSAVTATQMNHLQSLDVNVKQTLDSIDIEMLTHENHIYDLLEAISALQADKLYSTSRGAGGTSIMLYAHNISADKIDPNSLSIFVYEQTSSSTMELLNLSKIEITTSDDFLSTIEIAEVVSGTDYQIVIRYRLADETS